MKICDTHWAQLRTAIEERGLSPFVAKNGEIAAKNMVAQLHGTDSNAQYDPLMAANFAIWSNALNAFGLEIMHEDAPCPLCALDHHVATCTTPGCPNETGANWIKYAADGQLEVARERGLVGEPN